MDKLLGAHNCSEAYFQIDDVKYSLCLVEDVTINQMMHDKNGQPIEVVGYPAYYTRSGRLWPLPTVEVIYE